MVVDLSIFTSRRRPRVVCTSVRCLVNWPLVERMLINFVSLLGRAPALFNPASSIRIGWRGIITGLVHDRPRGTLIKVNSDTRVS